MKSNRAAPARAPRRILVARGGAIGDFILTLPVLAALRRKFTAARIEVLGPPRVTPLAVAGGLADAARSLDSAALAPLFARDGKPDRQTAAWLAATDLFLSYLHDPGDIFRAHVAACTTARWIAGPHRPDESQSIHVTEVLLRPLARLGIVNADPVPRLELAAPARPEPPQGRWLAMHPGSGSERKNWPEQAWAALIRRILTSTDWNIFLAGGEAEIERVRRLARPLPSGRARVAEGWPLVELGRHLQGCAAYLGHDSGISHLAAALGMSGLILWGETHEAVWRPRSDRVEILRPPRGLATLSPVLVIERLRHFPSLSRGFR